MRVNCDVCGGEPAAVLCCADEAALCSACDRRVHRANKLAGKHRRIPLHQHHNPSNPTTAQVQTQTQGPLCDVCRERRGLVFCVEDRAILCADCDDPIHSANDLTAKHSRFLLVGAKLSSTALEADPSDPSFSVAQEQDSRERSSVLECSSGNDGTGGGAMISDYLTNICPGWRVDDLLFDESPFSAAAKPARQEEHVPSMDADLFDVVAGRQDPEKRGQEWAPQSTWTGGGEVRFDFEEVNTKQKQGRARETYWNNNSSIDNDRDVFAVPEMTPPPAKRARPSSSSFWCF